MRDWGGEQSEWVSEPVNVRMKRINRQNWDWTDRIAIHDWTDRNGIEATKLGLNG